MIDGVILVAILIPTLIATFVFMVNLVTGESGTKGLTKQSYRTRDGKLHTAKRSREQHII